MNPDSKVVLYNKDGGIEAEYPINWNNNERGGTQIFLVATEDAGPGGETRCVACCSKGFLVEALSINAAKHVWLREALSAVCSAPPGFLGYLKSPAGIFVLGMLVMMGINWFFYGLTNHNLLLTIVGAVIAGVCFCAHHFLPTHKGGQ